MFFASLSFQPQAASAALSGFLFWYGGLGQASMMGGNGMMSGMMGGWNYQATPSANVSAEMTVTPEQAVEYAQQYLDSNYAGTSAASDPTKFYGYYTLDFEKDGKAVGMLSVNGYNGQIFMHTWVTSARNLATRI